MDGCCGGGRWAEQLAVRACMRQSIVALLAKRDLPVSDFRERIDGAELCCSLRVGGRCCHRPERRRKVADLRYAELPLRQTTCGHASRKHEGPPCKPPLPVGLAVDYVKLEKGMKCVLIPNHAAKRCGP